MNCIYFDCAMGAAGDMLTAALLELHPKPDEFLHRLNNCGLTGTYISAERITSSGIVGTHMNVLLDGVSEDNTERHCHRHEHMNVREINTVIDRLILDDKVKEDIRAVFGIIADAECKVHGKSLEQIHFHEVGTMDAVADITAVCMLISELKPDKIFSSPINVGGGTVKCAHGILPVPAPATAEILIGIPTYSGIVKSELCTPTGAALLKYFTNEFIDMPKIAVSKIGYGMGTKKFESLNCIRAFFGNLKFEDKDEVNILSCNIDDMTGEQLGFTLGILLDNGVLDAWSTPIYMKKNRPAYMLSCMCKPEHTEKTVQLIFKHTSTLGIRITENSRCCLERESIIRKTKYGDVRVKRAFGYGVMREKAEYDDVSKIAIENDIPLNDVMKMIK